jgi:hypothetical protein
MKLIALLLRPFVVSFLLDKRARSLLCTSHRALKFKEVLLYVFLQTDSVQLSSPSRFMVMREVLKLPAL